MVVIPDKTPVRNEVLANALDIAHRQTSPKHAVPASPEDVLDFAVMLDQLDEQDVILHRSRLMDAADCMVEELALPYRSDAASLFPHLADYRAEKKVIAGFYGAPRESYHVPIISLHTPRAA